MEDFYTCNTNWEPWGWMDACCTCNVCNRSFERRNESLDRRDEAINKCNEIINNGDDSWEIDLETLALIVLIVLGILLIVTLVLPWIVWSLGSV